MIKRFDVVEKDQINLKRLLKNHNQASKGQPENYRYKVVLKPWGFEYLLFENEFVAVWFLHIKKDHATSMHCHPLKRTSLIVLDGTAACSTFHHRTELEALAGIILEKGVFHTTKSLNGIDVIEIETPPNKTDLVRYNDLYGRKTAGYESSSEMRTTNLEQDFGYCWFEASQKTNLMLHQRYSVEMHFFGTQAEYNKNFHCEPDVLYCNCGGGLLNSEGDNLWEIGVVMTGASLATLNPTTLLTPLTLMNFRRSET